MASSPPRSPGRGLLLLTFGLVAVAACRHLAPAIPGLPEGWEGLKAAPAPFAALYRLDCCGQRNLLLTVRGDGDRLVIAVAAPPAGTVLDAFLSGRGGWATSDGGRCVSSLPPGELPLREGNTLPLNPLLAATLLSGTLPGEAREIVDRPGWVGAVVEGLEVRWRIVPGPPRCAEVEVSRADRTVGVLRAEIDDHHARVPGRLDIRSGHERALLRLIEWQRGGPLVAPAWTAAPPCREAP